MADWVTISALATAGGTLVLAVATFGSTRSANRAARIAEQSLLANMRPVLMPSRPDDPEQKIAFYDEMKLVTPGGRAATHVGGDAIYLTIGLRNVGTGIAVLHGWWVGAGRVRDRSPLEDYHQLSVDLYVPVDSPGYWLGALRDPSAPEYRAAADAMAGGEFITIDLLYGDHLGAQRYVTRFSLRPLEDGTSLPTVIRHWSVDGHDPRGRDE
jgi:hypothetical protein